MNRAICLLLTFLSYYATGANKEKPVIRDLVNNQFLHYQITSHKEASAQILQVELDDSLKAKRINALILDSCLMHFTKKEIFNKYVLSQYPKAYIKDSQFCGGNLILVDTSYPVNSTRLNLANYQKGLLHFYIEYYTNILISCRDDNKVYKLFCFDIDKETFIDPISIFTKGKLKSLEPLIIKRAMSQVKNYYQKYYRHNNERPPNIDISNFDISQIDFEHDVLIIPRQAWITFYIKPYSKTLNNLHEVVPVCLSYQECSQYLKKAYKKRLKAENKTRLKNIGPEVTHPLPEEPGSFQISQLLLMDEFGITKQPFAITQNRYEMNHYYPRTEQDNRFIYTNMTSSELERIGLECSNCQTKWQRQVQLYKDEKLLGSYTLHDEADTIRFTKYEYDKNGNLLSAISNRAWKEYFSVQGNCVFMQSNSYLQEHLYIPSISVSCISQHEYLSTTGSDQSLKTREYHYDSLNHLSCVKENGQLVNYFIFNEKGELTYANFYSSFDYYWEYNQSGKPTRYTIFSGNNAYENCDFEYNEEGLLIKVVHRKDRVITTYQIYY